jgi:hypothetical protein
MPAPHVATVDEFGRAHVVPASYPEVVHTNISAVCWGAIVAGAAAAAALSLILLLLGAGLGLSSVSPWAYEGVSAPTFGVSTILWLSFTQIAASGTGGYLAGRLRTKWTEVHTDEVYFRDTAHGFLAWAVASLATAALLTSVIGSIVSGGIKTGAAVADSVATSAAAGAAAAGASSVPADTANGAMGYFVDSLFRKSMSAGTTATPAEANAISAGAPEPSNGASDAEVTRIFMNTAQSGALPADDVRYVGQIVAQRTGLTQPEAEKRVSDTYARMQAKLRDAEATAKEAADQARKASAYTMLWLFVSLLLGAFVASLAATYGGRRRDT